MTWNINGLDEKRLDQRMEKLCLSMLLGGSLRDAMAQKPMRPVPDIIVLQEVIRRSHLSHLSKHFAAAGFTLRPSQPSEDRNYYEAIAVRAPFELVDSVSVPFDESPLGRHALVSTVRANQVQLRVVTAHMESLRSGRAGRFSQARQLDRIISDAGMPCVFAGDTNLRMHEWKELKPQLDLLDAFEVAGSPNSQKHTWLTPEDGRQRRGYRFDRVWFDAMNDWKVELIESRWLPKVTDHSSVEVQLCF